MNYKPNVNNNNYALPNLSKSFKISVAHRSKISLYFFSLKRCVLWLKFCASSKRSGELYTLRRSFHTCCASGLLSWKLTMSPRTSTSCLVSASSSNSVTT